MKKFLSLILVIVASSVSAMVYAGTPIKQTELPNAAQTFLSKHFPGDAVIKAEKDQGRRGMEYEVDLQSGAEIDFRDNGDWKEVKAARGNAVPSAIVPSAIAKYVSANFNGQSIVEIPVNAEAMKWSFRTALNSNSLKMQNRCPIARAAVAADAVKILRRA